MSPKLLFTISAIYHVLAGLGLLLVPEAMVQVPLAGTPAAVGFSLRDYGAVLLGIAVLHWLVRDADASKARDAIFIAATFAYALVMIVLVIGLVTGATPVSGWILAIIDALFVVAFFMVGRANMSTSAS